MTRRPVVTGAALAAVLTLPAVVALAGCSGGAQAPSSSRQAGVAVGHQTAAGRSPGPGRGAGRRAPPHWPTIAVQSVPWRLPEPVGREAVISVGGPTAVVAGGLVAGDASTASSFRVDVTTGRRTPLPDLLIPVHDAWGVDAAGIPLVLGGGNLTEQSAVQALRPSDRWGIAGHLPGPRSDLVAAVARGRVLVFGGYDGVTAKQTILAATNPGSRRLRFRPIGRLPVAVRYPAVVTQGRWVWLFGGEDNGHMLDVVQRVDPRTGQAVVAGRLPHPLGHAMAVRFGARILLVGGRPSEATVTGALWWFDPLTGGFHRAGRLPHPLADAGVIRVGHTAYLLGGETPGLSSGVLRLSPVGGYR